MSLNCVLCRYDEAGSWCVIPCGCVFHSDCLVIFLASSKSCPDCKKSCKPSDIIKLYINPAEDSDAAAHSEEDLKRKIIEIEKKLKNKESELDDILKQNSEIADRIVKQESDSNDSKSKLIQQEKYKFNLKDRVKDWEHKLKEIPKHDRREVNATIHRIETLKKIGVILKQSKEDVADLIEMQLAEVDRGTYETVTEDFVHMLFCLEHEIEEKKKIKCSYCTMLENKYKTILSRYVKCKEEIQSLKQLLKKKIKIKKNDDENVIKVPQIKRVANDTDEAISVDFSKVSKKINTVVLSSAQPSLKGGTLRNNFTSKVNVVRSSNLSSSITRVGYNGLGGHESVVVRSNPVTFVQKKCKKLSRNAVPLKPNS